MRLLGKALTTTIAGMTLAAGLSTASMPAAAGDGGAIALGAIGGLAAGAMLGGALSGPRYYAPPRPVYRAYYPAYAPDYDACFNRRVWGPYGWHWVRYCD